MTWKQEENSSILSFVSLATTSVALGKDLEHVFARLNEEQIIQSGEMLLFIDATNGNMFISGFDHRASEVFDDRGIWIGLQNMSEENSNAYDFDEIAITALKKAIKSKYGTELRKHFKIFYQTEEEGARELK
jgi:hypothetical protein